MKLFSMIKNVMSNEKSYINEYVFKKEDKVIHFQEMVHVASPLTYQKINNRIHVFMDKHKEGKIYLEGIHGEKSDAEKLNHKMMKIMGINLKEKTEEMFLKAIYRAVAYITNKEVQHESNYLKDVSTKKKVKADITFAEMYDKIKDIEESEKPIELDLTKEKLDKIKKYRVVGWFAKKALKTILRNKEKIALVSDKKQSMKDLQSVILHERNLFLVSFLNESPDNHIFVTYGAAHYVGVKEEMIKKGFEVQLEHQIEYN